MSPYKTRQIVGAENTPSASRSHGAFATISQSNTAVAARNAHTSSVHGVDRGSFQQATIAPDQKTDASQSSTADSAVIMVTPSVTSSTSSVSTTNAASSRSTLIQHGHRGNGLSLLNDSDDDSIAEIFESPPNQPPPIVNAPTEASVRPKYMGQYVPMVDCRYRDDCIALGNIKLILVLMSCGLKGENGDDLVDLTKEPFKSIHKDLKPKVTRKNLIDEVIRRSRHRGDEKQPNAWRKPKLQGYLWSHPCDFPADNLFIRQQVVLWVDLENCRIAEDAQAKAVRSTNKSSDIWKRDDDYFRLIHVLVLDELKDLLFESQERLDRIGIDSRHAADAPDDFFEASAELYNDPDFNPTRKEMGRVHPDFATSRTLYQGMAPQNVAAAKIKSKYAHLRVQAQILNSRYSASGNGDGQPCHETGEIISIIEIIL